jgi:hypothetical protein
VVVIALQLHHNLRNNFSLGLLHIVVENVIDDRLAHFHSLLLL